MVDTQKQTGVSLIEVIVGIGIMSAMLVAIGFSILTYLDARAALLSNMKSAYLAEEGYELLRAFRDDDWDAFIALSTDTVLYFDLSTTTIAVSATPEIIDTDYRRSFIIRDLYRNSNDDVVASTTSGASVDSDSRIVEIYVANPNGTTSMQAILANVFAQ